MNINKPQHSERWIWLPKAQYPDRQETIYVGLDADTPDGNYTVAEFSKIYTFDSRVKSAEIRFSGDTAVHLFLNGKILATGPASVGGDFLDNDTPRDNFYAYEVTITPDTETLSFFARVQMMPVHICEYSKGRGGLMLSAVLTFGDGTQRHIETDDSWKVRVNRAYTAPKRFDGTLTPDEYVQAECTENIWYTTIAPIPVRAEREIVPMGGEITLAPFEKKTAVLELDRIWAGFIRLTAKTTGEVRAHIMCREIDEQGSTEEIVFTENGEYRGFYMHSAGNLLVELENLSTECASVRVSFIETHYPVTAEATTETSDEDLNLVLDTCKHTLKICRQTHHLDSPRHCEPLACTGDYYIESLMTLFSFGDMRLSKFDIIRTAVMLERNDGRIFHTTYSLIWVLMLWDIYMATGDRALLERCEKGLRLLLSRFERYIGENGLVETPPDYMFVDWIYIDDLSMHHPPKALGQSCLNMFYFGALKAAEKIFNALHRAEDAAACSEKRSAVRDAINTYLFDAEKGMYFEGLNTPTEEYLLGKWMPQNTDKRYYLKHSNILAACFGVCDAERGRDLIGKIMTDEIPGEYQPYFAHFLLEAIYNLGMREKYTLDILERWKEPVRACPKGLVEGFVKPEPTYAFDHSHAWGGTPLYALPKALMGLEILEPGMKRIKITPSLLGLRYARTELQTPYGKVVCVQREGEAAEISAPGEVEIIL